MKYSLKEEMPGLWFVDLKVDGELEDNLRGAEIGDYLSRPETSF